MEKKEEYIVCMNSRNYYIGIILCVIFTLGGYWMFSLDASDSLFEHRSVGFIHLISIFFNGSMSIIYNSIFEMHPQFKKR